MLVPLVLAAVAAAAQVPTASTACGPWVVGMTDDGFTVIEANTSSGVNIIQLWGPQRYGRLGDFYREHGIIK